MVTQTHCDRCGYVGEHKGDNGTTNEFPGAVVIRPHKENRSSMMFTSYNRELCVECTIDLAEFLDDDKLIEKATPDGHDESGDLPDTMR